MFGHLEADHPHQLSSKFCRAYEEMLASRSKGNLRLPPIHMTLLKMLFCLTFILSKTIKFSVIDGYLSLCALAFTYRSVHSLSRCWQSWRPWPMTADYRTSVTPSYITRTSGGTYIHKQLLLLYCVCALGIFSDLYTVKT